MNCNANANFSVPNKPSYSVSNTNSDSSLHLMKQNLKGRSNRRFGYTFFASTLLGRQWLDPSRDIEGYNTNIDYYFPIFTTLQFLFYIGWLKTAEALLNPYGEDDEDFDTNWMVDRHLQVSYMMVRFENIQLNYFSPIL